MDNKVTKKRLNDQLEYDWFKYVLILIASIIVWIFVFNSINANKDYEDLNIFATAYSSKDNNFTADLSSALYEEGDDLIRDINLEIQSATGKDYNMLLQTHGMISSDMLILGESTLKNIGNSFLEISDELLNEYLLPEGKTVADFEYYTYVFEDEEKPENNFSRRCAIKISSLNKINKLFDFKIPEGVKVPDEIPEGEEYKYDTNFYLCFNQSSLNIGKYNSKADKAHTQTFFTAKYLLEKYN